MSGAIQPGGILMPGAPLPPACKIAEIFPMLRDEQRESFRASLAEKQNHPIVLWRGTLLDGRNRARELIELKKPISYVIFVGTPRDALDYVMAENFERRHLDESQRAWAASAAAKMRLGDNQHSQPAQICAPSLPLGEQKTDPAEEGAPLLSQTEAAEVFGVSRRSVQHATTVREKGAEELQHAVETGTVKVSAAADIAALPIEEQRKIIAAADPKVVKEVSKKNREDRQAKSREKRLANMATAENLTLIEGRKYGVHLIDVPREFVKWSDATGAEKSPENHYRVEAFDYLANLREKILAASSPNCVAVMWAWGNSIQDQFDLLVEWGFAQARRRGENGLLLRDGKGAILPPVGDGRYRSQQIWAKRNADGTLHRGTGFWFIDGHELLLYGARGDVPAPLPGTQARSLLDLPIGGYSEKPHEHIRDQLDAYFPGVPKLEWFARVPDFAAFKKRHPYWDVTGNEAAQQPVREAAE